MDAIVVREPGRMQWESCSLAPPGEGEARIRVEAAGVNFIDVYHRKGLYPVPLPFVPGVEGAGVIEALGPGNGDGLTPGMRVAWAHLVPGSYATHALLPRKSLVPVPDGLDARTAAAAMLQGMTAHFLARDAAKLRPAMSCLVLAAAGGVGGLLCQMAKGLGVKVIGCVSSDEKAAIAQAAGAHEIIRYDRTSLGAEARRLTGGRGVDVVFDSVGRATFDESLQALAPRGLLVLFGQSSGLVPPLDLLWLSSHGSLFLTRPTLGHYTATREELLGRAGEVLGSIAAGRLKLRIDRELPLKEAAEAHRALEARETRGKVLLIP